MGRCLIEFYSGKGGSYRGCQQRTLGEEKLAVKKKLYIYNKKSIQSIGLLDNGKREYKNIWHSQLKKGEKNLKVLPISLNLQMTLQTMVFILVQFLLFSD